jgi:hypothetical protein
MAPRPGTNKGDVAHLVNIDGKNEAESELPSEGGPVDADGEEHGEEGAALGEAEEEELGLGEQEDGDEFEFPEQESEPAKAHDAAGAGPVGVVSGMGGLAGAGLSRRGVELLAQIGDLCRDDLILA